MSKDNTINIVSEILLILVIPVVPLIFFQHRKSCRRKNKTYKYSGK